MVVAYITSALILIGSMYASHIWYYLFKNVKLAANRLTALLIAVSILLTESVSKLIGYAFIIISNPSTRQEFIGMETTLNNIVKITSLFSPYHAGGRILTIMLGHYTGPPDIQLILPLFLIISIIGFIVGKKIYLDVFMND
jgi:hypothetical protein